MHGNYLCTLIELSMRYVFNTNKYPKTKKEHAKKEVWRKTMDLDIEVIERNNTWEFIILLKGGNKIEVK